MGQFEQLLGRDLIYEHPKTQGVRIGDLYYHVSGAIASQGILTREIEHTRILGGGNIDPWVVAGTLPAARDQAAVAASSSNIYILGNWPGTTLVERIPVDSPGNLGSAVTVQSMGTPRNELRAMVHGGYLYAIGGANSTAVSSVERVPINSDGSLGSWEQAPSLNGPRSSFALAKTSKYVWVIGGANQSGNLGTIERAELLSEGNIGAWEVVAATVQARSLPSALEVGSCIFVVGGIGPGGPVVECLQFDGNEDIIAVLPQPNLTVGRMSPGLFADEAYLFATGGDHEKTTERAPLLSSS